MTKRELFEILDELERRTRPLAAAARERLAAAKGPAALEPWNRPAALAGESERALDPYFAFEDAVSVWARSFAALGVSFGGGASTLVLDLCDRKGKYSNGFCHWPKLSSVSVEGTRLSAEARLSSLATPDAVGSGKFFFLSFFSSSDDVVVDFVSFLPFSLSLNLSRKTKQKISPTLQAAPPSPPSSTSAATPPTSPTSSRGRRWPPRSARRRAWPMRRRSRCSSTPSPTTPRGRGATAARRVKEVARLLLRRRRGRSSRRRSRTRTRTRSWRSG